MKTPHHNPQMRKPRGYRRPAFTLVELVIVVGILAILAALVVPHFSHAADNARENSLKQDLKTLRTQIMVYRAQHGGVSPGYPGGDIRQAPTYESFVAQLTRYTDEKGAVADSPGGAYRFGPYLARIPANPMTESSAVKFIANNVPFPSDAAGDEGWVYQPSTGALAANVPGTDPQGTDYFDY